MAKRRVGRVAWVKGGERERGGGGESIERGYGNEGWEVRVTGRRRGRKGG